MPKVNGVDHVAIIVQDIETSLKFWRDALGLPLAEIRNVPAEAAQVAFLPAGNAELELVKPETTDSGISRFLAKHGPGIHHVCLQVDDLPGMLERLRRHGARLIEPQPEGGGKAYAFVHPESTGGVLLELYQSGA